MARVPFIYGGFGLRDGEIFEDSAVYYEISGSGQILKKYGEPQACSIEDEMYVSDIHRVIGDSLYEFISSHRFMFEPEIKVELLIRGLVPYENPLPFDADAVINRYWQSHNKSVFLSDDNYE